MKIIMNNIKNKTDVEQSFCAVELAIQDKIKEGRHNFKGYGTLHPSRYISVCKNKNSFTIYINQ